MTHNERAKIILIMLLIADYHTGSELSYKKFLPEGAGLFFLSQKFHNLYKHLIHLQNKFYEEKISTLYIICRFSVHYP